MQLMSSGSDLHDNCIAWKGLRFCFAVFSQVFVGPRILHGLNPSRFDIRASSRAEIGRWHRWTGQNQVTDSLTVSLPSMAPELHDIDNCLL